MPIRPAVGSRDRAALDEVLQLSDPFAGRRQDARLQEAAERGQDDGGHHRRHGQTIQADAAGLGGRDLVGLGQQAEDDQRRDQHRDRRDLVENLQDQIAVVLEHDGAGNVVSKDVVDPFRQVRDDVDGDAGEQDQADDACEPAHHVAIQQVGKAQPHTRQPQHHVRARRRWGRPSEGACLRAAPPPRPPTCRQRQVTAEPAVEGRRKQGAVVVAPRQQEDPESGEQQVG